MHRLSIKLFALITGILAVLLLILNMLPVVILRDIIIDEKEASFSSHGSVISSSLSLLDVLSRDSINEVMNILDITDYDRILIASSSGQILYDSAGNAGQTENIDDLQTGLDGNTVFRSDFSNGSFTSSYAVPISHLGRITGVVYLYEDDIHTSSIITDLRHTLENVSVVITVLVLLIVYIFSYSLYRRFRTMSDSMRIVGNGDYSHRLVTEGRDELAELGEEFNSLTERLEANENQRRQFVADASHELKTPLASIRLLSDSIVQNAGMDSETMREFVSDIGHEADRLQRTTEKLLDLSRLDDNAVQLVPEPVDVKQISQDAISVLAPLAEDKHVYINADLDDGCVIMSHNDDVFHIVFNLMENAVKYNVENGSVSITLSKDEQYVTFTVADTGIGIPESDRLNIFLRFYRVDKARSREAGGSGLGLSIVHDAVLAIGGTITVGSNKPQGSVFIVTFPRATSEETGI